MFIPNEVHYRELILSEHWDEFVSRLPKLEAPFSIEQQAAADMTAHFVAEQIMGEYPDDYPQHDED